MKLQTAALKAYKTTDVYKLEKLLTEQSRWKRKLTIATNKLAEVRSDIESLASRLAMEKHGGDK